MTRVIVVGAGVSGLSAARALSRDGFDVLVFERARGVGGRCATRRVNGQPVDHGAPFLHGRDECFIAEVQSMGGTHLLEGWPQHINGQGVPCQPRAFAAREVRVAVREGMSRFAKHLESGLDVRLESRVTGIEQLPKAGGLRVQTDTAEMSADGVVLAMPIPQAERLWHRLKGAIPQLDASRALLQLPQMVACLAVIARYGADVPAPDWQARYPSESRILQAAFVDSSKRNAPARLTLVLHARPAFSRTSIEQAPENWAQRMVAEAGAVLGPWASEPESVQPHRWSHARVQPASELTSPLLFQVEGGGWLGLCGDAFHQAGGVEGAYLSGLHLASLITATAVKREESNSAIVHG